MIIHYNCTRLFLVAALGCFLLHSSYYNCTRLFLIALVIADLASLSPYIHEMIFILVPLIFLLVVVKLERQGAPKMIGHTLRMHARRIHITACALAQTAS